MLERNKRSTKMVHGILSREKRQPLYKNVKAWARDQKSFLFFRYSRYYVLGTHRAGRMHKRRRSLAFSYL